MILKRNSATACVTTSLANMPADALIGTRAEWINPFGFFVFLLACHSRSVIARSASGRRKTTSNPVSSTATLARLATVETENIVMTRSVGKGVTTTKEAQPTCGQSSQSRDSEVLYGDGTGKLKRLQESEGKSRSAQSLPVTAELFSYDKRICTKCGVNEIYVDIRTMDWCEPCIWEFVKDDSNN